MTWPNQHSCQSAYMALMFVDYEYFWISTCSSINVIWELFLGRTCRLIQAFANDNCIGPKVFSHIAEIKCIPHQTRSWISIQEDRFEKPSKCCRSKLNMCKILTSCCGKYCLNVLFSNTWDRWKKGPIL